MGYQESLERCIAAHNAAQETASKLSTSLQTRELNVRNPAYWLGLSGSRNSAGVNVTPMSAMRTSAVWACIRVLSTSYASLPLHVKRRTAQGMIIDAVNEPIYDVLHRNPNPEQTSFIFRMVAMAHLCLYGNAYAEIEFDYFGNPINLWPIPAWCCRPLRTEKKELYYQVSIPDTGETKNLQPYRILHIMGLGTDGMQGLSPIRQHAETIGITLAADQFSGMFFSNGMNIGGIVEHPNKLSITGSTNLRNSLNEKYAGLGNSHRLMLLEEGMKYTKIGINPMEAQLLEERQYQIEDIARIYGVQLHKIGHLLHATFSNIEHQAIEFVTDTMLPWVVNFEQEYDRKLCFNGQYTKHSMEGLLRGDTAARAAFYKELFYISSITPDEIREKEDMNPEPDGMGRRYYIPGNMVPADRIDDYINKNTSKNTTQDNATRNLLIDAVRRIAEREKQNISRAAKKNDVTAMVTWIKDFYRDFPEYIERQLEPILGDKTSKFTVDYCAASQRALEGFNPQFADAVLANWEPSKISFISQEIPEAKNESN